MAIGARIKEELELRGKTAAWLSRETGIPATTLRSIIARDSWSINPEVWKKISKAFGLSFSDMFEPEGFYEIRRDSLVRELLRAQKMYIEDKSFCTDEEGKVVFSPHPYHYEITANKEKLYITDEQLTDCYSELAKYAEYLVRKAAADFKQEHPEVK